MSEVHELINNIYLLPEELFVETDTKIDIPPILEKVPFYQLEHLLERLPLAKRLGEITDANTLQHTAFGQEGYVFRLHIGQLDLAVKLMFDEDLPVHILKEVIETVDENKSRLIDVIDERDYALQGKVAKNKLSASFYPQHALNQAAGFALGHILDPERVAEPHSVLTFKDKAIGYAISFINGEVINIKTEEVLDPALRMSRLKLREHGVYMDVLGENGIKKDGVIQFIDLMVPDKIINTVLPLTG